jgi:hypothetical protein
MDKPHEQSAAGKPRPLQPKDQSIQPAQPKTINEIDAVDRG